jgi:Fe-S oxidoreductase
MATRDERHSTRGRANALVDALSSPDPRAALGDDALMEVLDLCLECKACKSECPMSVDMATLKSEMLYHRQGQRGTPLSARFFGNARSLNRFAPCSPRCERGESIPCPALAGRTERWYRSTATTARVRPAVTRRLVPRSYAPGPGQAR